MCVQYARTRFRLSYFLCKALVILCIVALGYTPALAELQVSFTSQPTSLHEQEVGTWTLQITDSAGAAASGVGLTVDLPPDFIGISGSDGGNASGQTVTWSGLSFPAGGNITRSFTARPDCGAGAGTGQQITATVTPVATVTQNNTDVPSNQVFVGIPTLTAEFVDSALNSVTDAKVGDTINWTLTIENIENGAVIAPGATVAFTLGGDFGSPSISSSTSHTLPTGGLTPGIEKTWTTGPIAAGGSAKYEISATIIQCDRTKLVNDAKISWACKSTPVTYSTSIALEILEPQIDITVTGPSPSPINYCTGSTVNIDIKNNGTGPAENFTLEVPNWPASWTVGDITPAGASFDTATKTFSIPDVNKGVTLPLTFTVKPSSCGAASEAVIYFLPYYENQCGPVTGTAYSTPVADPKTWRMETRNDKHIPEFTIKKEIIGLTEPAELGQELTYNVTVTYNDPTTPPAGGYTVNIQDTYNLKYTFVSATNTDGFTHSSPNINWSHNFTASGQSVVYEVKVKGPTNDCDAFASYDNKAEILSISPTTFGDCQSCIEPIALSSSTVSTFFPDINGTVIKDSSGQRLDDNDVCTPLKFSAEYVFDTGAPGRWKDIGGTSGNNIKFDTRMTGSGAFGNPSLNSVTVNGSSYTGCSFSGTTLDLSCLQDSAPAPNSSGGVKLVIEYSYQDADALINNAEGDNRNESSLTVPSAGTGCGGTPEYNVDIPFKIEGSKMTVTPGGPLFVDNCGIQDYTIEIGGGPHNLYDATVTLDTQGNYEFIASSASFDSIVDTSGFAVSASIDPVVSGTEYTWTFGDIKPQGTIKFKMRRKCGNATSDGWSASGQYHNTCENDGADTTLLPAVGGTHTPLIIKDGDPTLHLVPATILALDANPEFTVYIVNGGSAPLYNADLTLEFDTDIEYASHIIPTGSNTPDNFLDTSNRLPSDPSFDKRNIKFHYNGIAAGARQAIDITTLLAGCENMKIKATLVWCDGDALCDLPLTKESTVVMTGTEVTVTEHSGGPLEYCGDVATFTIKTKNTGKVTVYDPLVTELLPAGVVYDSMVSGSAPTITDESGRKRLTWSFPGNMSVGTEYSVEFKVKTDVDASGCPLSTIFTTQQAEAKATFKRPCETTAAVGQGAPAPRLLLFQAANPEISITKKARNISKDTGAAFVTGEVDADPGDTIEWQITLTNTGDYVAKDASLEDVLPSNVGYKTGTGKLDGSGLADGWLSGLSLGDIATGITRTVLYQTTVNAGGCTSSPTTNTATVTYGCCGTGSPAFEEKTASIGLRTQPDFGTGSKIEITHNNWTTCNGEVVIKITNNGGTALSEQIVDTLPAGYTYDDTFVPTVVAVNTPPGVTAPAHDPFDAVPVVDSTNKNILTWNSSQIDKIYPGESITITFRVKRDGDGSATCGTPGTNNKVDFDYHTNCSLAKITDTKTQSVTLAEADVEIKLEVTQEAINLHDIAQWTLTLTNNGTADAYNITVTDTLGVGFGSPSDTQSGSWTGNTGTWTITGPIAKSGGTWTTVISAEKAGENSLTNTASVVGTCQTDDKTAETCEYVNKTASAYAGFSFSKTVDNPTANIGEERIYTITADFADTGSADSYTGVTIADTLPAGLAFVSAAQNGGDFSVAPVTSSQNISWSLPTFTGPKSFSYNVTVRVVNDIANQAGTGLDNDAVVSYTLGSDTFTDNATAKITVTEPNLELTKTITAPAGGSGAEAGDTTSWQIILKNEAPGDGTAYQVELKDVLPDGLNNISGVSLVKSGTGNAYINGTTTPVTTAHLHVLTTKNANDTLDLAIASDGADTIQLEPDTTLTITFDAVIMNTVSTGAVLKNEITSPYKSTPTDNTDTRDDADNPDDDDINTLNNYGETASATLSLAAGKVGDTVWFDTDNDGVQDTGEPGIANVTVTLYDGSSNVVATAVTDTNGKYLFTNLPTGNYRVAVTSGVPAGLAPSPAQPIGSFTLPVNGSQMDRDFGYTNTSGKAVIGDLVWHDVNGDGVQNPGEPGIGGVNLSLIGPGTDGMLGTADDAPVATTTTAADGSYLFTGVDPGNYLVKVTNAATALAGYTSTTGGNTSSLVTVAAGDSYLNADFGYNNPALHTISDTVWNDPNGNGTKDGGESGIPGVTVNLLNSDGVIIATTTTDSSGNFSFPGLPNGNYTVVIEDNTDKLQGYLGTTTEGKNRKMPVTVNNADVTGVHFGYNRPGVIGDTVFRDLDGDGTQDADEPGIAGVTVELWKDDGDGIFDNTKDTLVSTPVTTDSNGHYLFNPGDPGKYFVSVDPGQAALAGYTLTTTDSQGTQANGIQMDANLDAGGSVLTADFGFQNTALPDVSGFIWEDLNVNKTDDGAGEPPFTGVTVALLDTTSGNVIAETTTDTTGAYTFKDVPPGDYTIKVTDTGSVLDGYKLTTAKPEYSITVVTTNITGLDFGYVKNPETGSIGNYVWEDTDGEGDQDEASAGLDGITVKLVTPGPDGLFDTADDIVEATQNTAGGGLYLFENLPAGLYRVIVDETTVPVGYGLTTANNPLTIPLGEGEAYTDADFGYQPQGTVTGHLFVDTNGNGTQESGEPNLPGVTVVITDSQGHTQNVVTDASGNYSAGVPTGSTSVDIDETTVPAGYVQTAGTDPETVTVTVNTTTNAGNDGYQPRGGLTGHLFIDTNGNGTQDAGEPNLPNVNVTITDSLGNPHTVSSDTNGNYTVTDIPAGAAVVVVDETDPDFPSGYVQTAGENPTTATVPSGSTGNAGNDGYQQQNASISDYVWNDANGDKVQDSTEKGIPGVVVYLDTNGDGVRGTGEPFATTDSNGLYIIPALAAGTYSVRVDATTVPPGYALTTENDPLSVPLAAGQKYTDADFGYRQSGSIGDYVWDDTDGDGVQDTDESPISGVVVYLDINSNGVRDTDEPFDETGTDGVYEIPGLGAGTYIVRVDSTTVPANHSLTTGNDPMTVDLASGQNYRDADFGYRWQGSLGDRVWIDADGDGVQDDGETGLENVRVYIDENGNGQYDPDEPADVTDADGRYTIDHLTAGTYAVRVDNATVPPEYGLTTGNIPLSVTISAGEDYVDADFGYRRKSSLGDRVWYDTNGNGIQDDGENGIPGVTVRLLDATGTELATTTTDADGLYEFTGLAPGDYMVEFVKPSDDYVFSPANRGSGDLQDAFDSDADTTTGRTGIITLGESEENLRVDGGIRIPSVTLSEIGDRVWLDADQDGIQDAGETGVAGVTVRLLNGAGNFVSETTTDGSGFYKFTSLLPGDYQVVFVAPTGYSFSPENQGGDDGFDSDAGSSDGKSGVFTIAPGESNLTLDAGLFLPATLPARIGDRVWYDSNGDGIQDNGETGIPGVTVNLYDTTGTTLISQSTTDANGFYEFAGLAAGNYVVEFVKPSGYSVIPSGQGSDSALDSDPAPATGRVSVQVAAGENRTDVDAGLYTASAIRLGDLVWLDDNGNGSPDAGEGLPGVTVRLYDGNGNPLDSVVTDSDGHYEFPNLPPGDYRVSVDTTTLPEAVTPFADPDGTLDSRTDVVNQTTDNLNLDFGYRRSGTGSIGDRVWFDANGDGIQDDGETGISGVTVRLYDGNGNLLDTRTTDGTGAYLFADLPADNYRVEFVRPSATYEISPANQGTGDLRDAFDSDADPATGLTDMISLSEGENRLTVDAGMSLNGAVPASVGDRVWYDTNGDGVQDADERGLAGVTVKLLRSDGTVVAETTTDGTGAYEFTGIAPGEYQVEFTTPSGYQTSPQSAGGNTATDSDAAPATGRTAMFTLASGESRNDIDAGMFLPGTEPGSIGDRVWRDANHDGIQGADETGLSGVRVILYDSAGTMIAQAVTDADGNYRFDGLGPADYRVKFVQPDGYTFSPADAGSDDAADSDANPADGLVSVPLEAGQHITDVDAGLYRDNAITIGDLIWLDKDDNGVPSGDEGLPGVTVILYDGNGNRLDSATTDANGNYEFPNLSPGDYRVEVNTATLPEGVRPLSDPDGNLDSRTDLLNQTSDNPDVDFGYRIGEAPPKSGTIGNFVWHDVDSDGVQDAGEPGISGVTVRLYDAGGTSLLAETVTDAQGIYWFTGLEGGDYVVEFVRPDGYEYTTPDQTGDAMDSDAATDTGRVAVTLPDGGYIADVDAGFFQPLSVGDLVWLDKNNDGKPDSGEGLPGVVVNIYDGAGNPVGTATTDADGHYVFNGLMPGDYEVRVDISTLPPDVLPLSDFDGGLDSQTTLDNLNADNMDVDFGYRAVNSPPPAGSIGDRVWLDADRNGVQNAGETGIPGVAVKLYDTNGSLLAETVTDAQGIYWFTGLDAGEYEVEFALPDGYGFTATHQGNTTLDSDADPVTGRTVVNLPEGGYAPDTDAGLYRLISIGDLVWLDKNNDASPGSGEGLPGVVVNLYGNSGNLLGTATTDADGHYEFPNLLPGDYRVVVDTTTLPAGVLPLSDPDGHLDSATDLPDQTTDNMDADFGYRPVNTPEPETPAGIIGNFVWHDANRNGVQDAGEPGISGVTVRLYDNTGALYAETATNSDGTYWFTGLPGGVYTVEFVSPDGYGFTAANQTGDTLDSDANPQTGKIGVFLPDGGYVADVDAGLYGPDTFTIGDLVWLDADGNGAPGSGEGIPGVTVNLHDGNGKLIRTTVTDSNGNYSFSDLPSGDYEVRVDTATLPDGVQPFSDLDGGLDSRTRINGLNADNPDVDFGYQAGTPDKLGTIGDRVWYDANRNGVQDAGENGFPGIPVTLYNSSGVAVKTTVTDSSGQYWFTGLPVGVYTVGFGLPDGYVFTAQNQGGDTSDSDANPSTGRSSAIYLPAGGYAPDTDAGIYRPRTITISHLVWEDKDGDGRPSPGEGLPGVTVNLYDGNGNLVRTVVTDENGYYGFTELNPGDYRVSVDTTTLPEGLAPLSDPDGGLDSTVLLDSQMLDNMDVDFGYRKDSSGLSGVIGDRVWYDTDHNGVQDADENGIPGVTVRLYDISGTILLGETVTDAEGHYWFTGLDAGDYTVKFVPPAGYDFTLSNRGNDSLDSDADPFTGKTGVISLPEGGYIVSVDAGLYSTEGLTIGDLVWLDADGNGIPGSGEGISGVRVNLYDGNGNLLRTVVTDGNGNYAFTGLLPGDYQVSVDTETLPAGAIAFADPDGGLDSSAALPGQKTDNPDVDFGYRLENTEPSGAIGDRVWYDTNHNGVQDAGEYGVPGVTVRLYDAAGNVVDETSTDQNGIYWFTGLNPGDYTVEFVQPAGYEFTVTGQGGAATDSDPSPETGRVSVTLPEGAYIALVDAGLYAPEALFIGDLVWLDIDGDGTPDSGEGLAGVRVILSDGAGNVIGERITDENGYYRFDGLLPGDYQVTVDPASLPEHVTLFSDPDGTPDGFLDLPDLGGDYPGADFGYRATVGNEPENPEDTSKGDLTNTVKTATDINGGFVVPGDVIAYAVSIYNSGEGPAENVVYLDTPDAYTKIIHGTVSATQGTVVTGNGSADTAIRVEIGTIAPGEAAVIIYYVQIKADTPAGVWVVNQGTVTADGMPDEPSDFPATAAINDPTTIGPVSTEVTETSVTISKSVTDGNGGTLEPGDTLFYEMLVMNHGPLTAENLVLSDTVPAHTKLVAGSLTTDRGTVSENGNTLVAKIGTLEPGETAFVKFQVVVSEDTATGAIIRNQAVLSGDKGIRVISDDPGQPNTDDPTLIVTGSNGTGGTGIFKTYWDINGGFVNPGDVLEYTVTAINTNTEKAVEMSFTDEISGFIHLVAGTVGTTQGVVLTGNADGDTAVSVSLGAVAPGGQAEVSFQVKVDEDTPHNTVLKNQGVILADGTAILTDDPSTLTPNDPTVTVVAFTPRAFDPPSSFKTYTGGRPVIRWNLQWINDTNDNALLVHVEDAMPDGAAYVAGSVGADYGTVVYDAENNKIVWEGSLNGNGGTVNIWYETLVDENTLRLENQACAIWDANGSGDWRDEAASGLNWTCTDDPDTSEDEDKTVWTGGCELKLGNRVWLDTNRDGYCALAEEPLMNGVKLNLYRDTDGNNVYTPGVDEFLQTALTESRDGQDGYYLFEHICEGDYIVQVDPANFAKGGLLYGYFSTDGASDPDDDIDHDDNGYPAEGSGVVSMAVSLRQNTEPVDEDGDANTNLTVDFGFYNPDPTASCPACKTPMKPF